MGQPRAGLRRCADVVVHSLKGGSYCWIHHGRTMALGLIDRHFVTQGRALDSAQENIPRRHGTRCCLEKSVGLPPQRVYACHALATYRQCHVIFQQPRDPGKACKGLPCFLGRHLARQGGRAAIQRALIHRTTPSGRPFPQEHHGFGDTIDFFNRMSLPARNPHGRKEMQIIHRFLPVDRDALDRTQ